MTTGTWLYMYGIVVATTIIVSPIKGNSQSVLFPGMTGTELQDALRENYRPSVTLCLDQAKDTLYAHIDNVQDSVEGIYSGLKLFLPDGVDASQWLFMNGTGINLEHVYPQSKGANEGRPGHSDMHHLYPARAAVNEARSNYPFDEIPDNITSKWFYKGLTIQSIPTSNIDAYSESMNGAFEPRESVKGNIARAMFYFYTMYQEDADAADPLFFANQRETLCTWHLDDPIDEAELQRSIAVAVHQDGKENPFVLDCTAAMRAWCEEFGGCDPSGVADVEIQPVSMIARNVEGQIELQFESDRDGLVSISVFDIAGSLQQQTNVHITKGSTPYLLNSFAPGLYFITGIMASQHLYLLPARCVIH